jgi:hypothetical protein
MRCARRRRGQARSQQPRARVIAEEMGIAHIAAQCVHTPMAALVHHFEDRGAAPRGRCQEAGPERMAGEDFRIKSDAASAGRLRGSYGAPGRDVVRLWVAGRRSGQAVVARGIGPCHRRSPRQPVSSRRGPRRRRRSDCPPGRPRWFRDCSLCEPDGYLIAPGFNRSDKSVAVAAPPNQG